MKWEESVLGDTRKKKMR